LGVKSCKKFCKKKGILPTYLNKKAQMSKSCGFPGTRALIIGIIMETNVGFFFSILSLRKYMEERDDRCHRNGTTRTLFGYCHLPALACSGIRTHVRRDQCGIDGRLNDRGYHRLANENVHFKVFKLSMGGYKLSQLHFQSSLKT
jgi:hypothetical protein